MDLQQHILWTRPLGQDQSGLVGEIALDDTTYIPSKPDSFENGDAYEGCSLHNLSLLEYPLLQLTYTPAKNYGLNPLWVVNGHHSVS